MYSAEDAVRSLARKLTTFPHSRKSPLTTRKASVWALPLPV
jgi:hypothetical protein